MGSLGTSNIVQKGNQEFDFAGQMLNFRNAAYSKAYRYVKFFGRMRTCRYRAKSEAMQIGGGDAVAVRADYDMPCHLAPDQLN